MPPTRDDLWAFLKFLEITKKIESLNPKKKKIVKLSILNDHWKKFVWKFLHENAINFIQNFFVLAAKNKIKFLKSVTPSFVACKVIFHKFKIKK